MRLTLKQAEMLMDGLSAIIGDPSTDEEELAVLTRKVRNSVSQLRALAADAKRLKEREAKQQATTTLIGNWKPPNK